MELTFVGSETPFWAVAQTVGLGLARLIHRNRRIERRM
jgi:predicted nicotinamide N-methyase